MRACQACSAGHISLEDLLEFLTQARLPGADSGVVDEDIQPATVCLLNLRHAGCNGIIRGHVGLNGVSRRTGSKVGDGFGGAFAFRQVSTSTRMV
jgi:hypothetical protein